MLPKKLLGRLGRLFKFLVISLLILGIVFWLKSDFWQIKRIDCRFSGDPCWPNLWAELMNKTLGKNILFLSPSKLALEIKQSHPEFSQVEISKHLPHNLLFEIEARKVVVAIGKEGGDFYLADKEGILLKKVKETSDLPRVLINNELGQNIGEKIEEEMVLKEILLLHQSQLRLLQPKSAQATSERVIEIRLKDDLQVLFSVQKDIDVQLDSLQFILERTKIEGEKPKRIDLRFDKPVITK